MEWRDIPGFEGRYQASDEGQVRSVRDARDIHARRRGIVLKAAAVTAGHGRGQKYLFVILINAEKKRKRMSVHRAVALAFLGSPSAGMEVRHLDGDAQNNRVVNLAWGTHRENVADTIAQGRHGRARETVCARGHVKVNPLHGNRCRECGRKRDRELKRRMRAAQRADARKADFHHAQGMSGGA